MKLRYARPDESEQLSELAMSSKAHWPYDQDYLEKCRAVLKITSQDILDYPFIVAEENGMPLGFTNCSLVRNENCLDHLWVEPSFIGRGVGRKLFNEAAQTARELGWSQFRIAADPCAEGFYLKLSARRIGQIESLVKPGFFLPLLTFDLPQKSYRLQASLDHTVRLAKTDDIPLIRRLVNSAYQELSDRGLNYTATYQDEAETRNRMTNARTFLLCLESEMLGTITMRNKNAISHSKCAYFGQFGIWPQHKRKGLGSRMMDFVEELASHEGYLSAQLDTAKPAEHLVRWYQSRGYRIIDETRFEGKTYESWIFEKTFA